MRAVAENRLEASDDFFALHLDRCLGCRACEPVCPSGVRYGHLLEHARQARGAAGGAADRLVRIGLKLFFGNRLLQNVGWMILRLLRASGLPALIARAGRAGAAPGRFRFAMAMVAATSPYRSRRLLGARRGSPRGAGGAPPDGEPVALLEGCVMAGLFGHVNRATERLVQAHGVRTARLAAGLCCGALHAHAGELDEARRLARRMIDAFEANGAATLATNSAGCGAALKDYREWLKDDANYADAAERISSAALDISEWLVGRPGPAYRALEERIGYDAPCHLIHAQRVNGAPIDALSRVPDLVVVNLPRSERCCGGAGIYGLMQRELSEGLLERKLYEAGDAGVRYVATGNPGCLMQIGAGALVHRFPIEVLHPVEVLDALLE
jgi:glycolate oxidase iron-sulfur subunit